MVAIKKFAKLIVYAINALLVTSMLGLLAGSDLVFLAYAHIIINYFPKWLLLVPFCLLILCLKPFTKTKTAVLMSVLIPFIWYQDFQFSLPDKQVPADFSVLTLNAGNGTDPGRLLSLVAKHKPDIILLQEFPQSLMEKTFDETWYKHCVSQLCITSKLELQFIKDYSRRLLGGWGSFVATYRFNIDGKTLNVVNLHLETPRSLLMGMIHGYFGKAEMQKYNNTKTYQAKIVSALLDNKQFAIAGGDFNLTVYEYQYRDDLAKFDNALSEEGWGLNYTKYTSWHGVRIDHLLSNELIFPLQAKVLPSVGGDHRPVLASFAFKSK
jgi:vancomycin resistance protein VanJ